jgi:hypothetical protein
MIAMSTHFNVCLQFIKGKVYHLCIKAQWDLTYTSVACAVDPSVTTSSTDFFFQNLVFLNLFEYLVAKTI